MHKEKSKLLSRNYQQDIGEFPQTLVVKITPIRLFFGSAPCTDQASRVPDRPSCISFQNLLFPLPTISTSPSPPTLITPFLSPKQTRNNNHNRHHDLPHTSSPIAHRHPLLPIPCSTLAIPPIPIDGASRDILATAECVGREVVFE